jgi:hypothetical protein
MRYLMNNEARSEESQVYPGRGRPKRRVKEGSTVLQNLSRLIGAWLSLVERFVRDEEVARSNRVAPKSPPNRIILRPLVLEL